MTLATIPDPKFIGWFRWTAIFDGSLTPEATRAFEDVGTYLLAQFPDAAPASVDRTDPSIFYVGETHGRTRCLRARLRDFGKSAGFLGAQQNGHYAAWKFPEYAENKFGKQHVYVAVCPYAGGSGSARDVRGVFPTLVESLILWSYTNRHGSMPALNNSGKQGELASAPVWDAEAVGNLFTLPEPYEPAEQLLSTLAVSHSYARRTLKRWTGEGWTGIERALGGGYSVSIGWRHDNREIGMWISRGGDYRFDTDRRHGTNEAQVRGLLDELWGAI